MRQCCIFYTALPGKSKMRLLSMQVTEVAREDPLQLSRNTVQEQTAVVAFTALYYSGLPFQVLALPMQCSLHSPFYPEAAIL